MNEAYRGPERETMEILHELGQLDFGGVEKVIRNIIRYDRENQHIIVAEHDGLFRKELEDVGAKIFVVEKGDTVDVDADVIHIHSGGAISNMASSLGRHFPVIETIHSPIRSPMKSDIIRQRVGVTNAITKINSKCMTIYNGIDLDTMGATRTPEEIKKELGIPEGIPIVGRLGRLGKDKCIEEWMLACYYLQQQGIEFVPLIVGGEARGLNGYVGKMKLLAESLPVKGIVWAGHHADIANYLQIMDVFLYPSPTEGFGLVFLEAMYSGAVVVSYNTPVTREVCSGYSILTEKSIPALVEGVKKALQVPIRDELIPLAIGWVETDFSAEKMSEEYQKLYASVAGKAE